MAKIHSPPHGPFCQHPGNTLVHIFFMDPPSPGLSKGSQVSELKLGILAFVGRADPGIDPDSIAPWFHFAFHGVSRFLGI